ncbi:glycoside hydrolase family 2 TIM barrel-domain containing protein [Olivibacter ginsenosidimutans]|uniref:Glycoside hydrolase family 2 TIM barrel-domain containing protein n=1 Tax=Olivibacter ginsenosidimutans TaxID=1176537 RepID=A0ABP9BHR8_9SPHI
MKNILFSLVAICLFSCQQEEKLRISLAGQWQFALDSTDRGIDEKWYAKSLTEVIDLPGTTDDAGKGIANTLKPAIDKPQILHLTRKNSYVGPAWYKKEVDIPAGWQHKNITLKLERVIWETALWVDGKKVRGKGESLSASHYYGLTTQLTPGKHVIALRIDNRKKYDISIDDKGHAYTNETQIMWNGVIGELALIAEDQVSIKQLDVYPDLEKKSIRIKAHIHNTSKATSGELVATVKETNGNAQLKPVKLENIVISEKEQIIELTYAMGDKFQTWSELSPVVYELNVRLKAGDAHSSKNTTFGMRDIKRVGAAILVNNQRVFMRGTLESCIFPLTGYPPTDKSGWEKVMKTAKEWGLNHLRFHSWCPPQAAFEVADELGMYLQIELPFWALNAGKDEPTNRFLYQEADRIVAEYGNHPSFCMFSMGNELQPDFDFLKNLLLHIKTNDSRRLYTTTSFTFERGHGDWPEPDDDFLITQWTKRGWVRGQGVFNEEPPRFDKDFSDASKDMPAPLITHEVGQYAVYPNLKEIEKYTGVLDPLNFKGVKQELERKGLITKADDYLKASGRLATLLYKEEIERALKTTGCSGFQLLDLHDYPGQSTALVGLLDAFWDSKGFTSSKEFQQFCSSVVPLIRYPKAVYTNDETFTSGVEIANYSNADIKDKPIIWELKDTKGRSIQHGIFTNTHAPAGYNTKIGKINCPLTPIDSAGEFTLSVHIRETEYMNSWKIWVYPRSLAIEKKDVLVTSNMQEAHKALKEGKKVLFNPSYETVKGLEGKFLPVFWSPVHFPKQAGTMGILCDPNHPMFAHFPTEMHTNWQWWNLLIESKTMITDSLYHNIEPIVECVDNFANNRRLASVFETQCENGKLLVCSMDLIRNMDASPEKRQFLYSVLEYMNSAAFKPTKNITFEKIAALIDPSQSKYERASAASIY